MSPTPAIDPLAGPKLALAGRVVTMNSGFKVIPRGVLYVENGLIVAVRDAQEPGPAAFANVPVIDTGGTVFPGLIELHNHLSYNILRLWNVPRLFTNRDQWGRTEAYQQLVTGPMKIIGETPDLLPAVARYVECKCLLGGVTTSQGIALFSNAGSRRYYRGIVRNVEQTDDEALPEAATRIADITAADAASFLARLRRHDSLLLHLSEGTDSAARDHFLALKLADGTWALDESLTGIHCAALQKEDFDVMASHGASMVWSPLSNLLLYGATARVADAKRSGVQVGIGSDWSVSGSKNLLGELKVARVVSEELGGVLSDRALVAMATRDAAAILGWSESLGSIRAGARADLVVIDGQDGDPYASLLASRETSIRLVLINGTPRFGRQRLMKRLGGLGEAVTVGGKVRMVFLQHAYQDPAVASISLASARTKLSSALRRLPQLAAERATARRKSAARSVPLRAGPEPLAWSLALDELGQTGAELRPRLPLPGRRGPTGPSLIPARPQARLASTVVPLTLDPLTLEDDSEFFDSLVQQVNVPDYVKAALPRFY